MPSGVTTFVVHAKSSSSRFNSLSRSLSPVSASIPGDGSISMSTDFKASTSYESYIEFLTSITSISSPKKSVNSNLVSNCPTETTTEERVSPATASRISAVCLL